MKILSWNVNGLGNVSKRNQVREVIGIVDPDIVMIQETKLEEVDRFLVHGVWDSRFKGWEFMPSVGFSGGLLMAWDTRVATKVDILVGSFSLSVLLDFKDRGCWLVTNVYGPTDPRLRGCLWEELSFTYGMCNPHWCVGSNFNVVRFPEERLGVSRINASMRGFDKFIRDCGLKDLPLSNAQFIWSVNRGRVVSSRIDRFFITPKWEDLFPNLIQELGSHLVSDHFPLILESNKVKWVLLPFVSRICGCIIGLFYIPWRNGGQIVLWTVGKVLSL